jgi:hypothetical protein
MSYFPKNIKAENLIVTNQTTTQVIKTEGTLNVPILTTTEKLALDQVNGTIVYDSTLDELQGYSDDAWSSLVASGGASSIDDITPTTTKGDIMVEDGVNVIRLAVGSDGEVLTADSAEASGVKWATASSYSDPLTTKGDLVARNSSETTRLAVGTNGQVLTADSNEVTGMKWTAGTAIIPTVDLPSTITLTNSDGGKIFISRNSSTVTLPSDPIDGLHFIFNKFTSDNHNLIIKGNGKIIKGLGFNGSGTNQTASTINFENLSTENSTRFVRLDIIFFSTGNYWVINDCWGLIEEILFPT